MKFVLLSCNFVYKTVVLFLNFISKLCKYIFQGFITTIKVILKFFNYALIGVKSLLILILLMFSYALFTIKILIGFIKHRNYENKKLKAQKQKEEALRRHEILLAKAKEKEAKKAKAEAALRDKMNAAAEKKRQRELNTYVNDKEKIEKKTFADRLDSLGNKIIAFPKKVKRNIKNKWNNLTFVKEAHNRRDINREVLLINFDGEDAKKSKIKLTYEYVIKNPEGKIVKGYFDAFSKVEVHSFLLSEGNTVYSIKTSKWIQLVHGHRGQAHTKFKMKDLTFFLAQLSTYIKAGIPLVDSIKILIKQFKNTKYKSILKNIVYDLSTGQSFSEALEKQGNAFPNILINMIKSAEMTGELPEALDDMEEYFSEAEATRKAMVTAMMYPAIIFIIAIGVGTFIMLFVVPKFVDIYKTMDNADIPGITMAVLALSDFLQKYIIWIFAVFIILLLIFLYLYKNVKSFRGVVQWTLMHLPVFGNVIIYNEVTMFSKTFASLLSHNVFITDSMEILNKVTNNEIYKMMIFDSINNIAKGKTISAAFKDQWAFPIPAYEMIVTGEKTGQLSEMMKKVSTYYQDLHKNAVARIKTFIEPALIITLAIMVGVIVLAIVIPMFNIYGTIQAQ